MKPPKTKKRAVKTAAAAAVNAVVGDVDKLGHACWAGESWKPEQELIVETLTMHLDGDKSPKACALRMLACMMARDLTMTEMAKKTGIPPLELFELISPAWISDDDVLPVGAS